MATFKTFRHKLTGEVKTLPANYAALFSEVLEEVDPSLAHCTDCGVPEPKVAEDLPAVEEIETFEEPSPRRRSRKTNDTVE